MWYAFIPDNPNIQEEFAGFTDNPFIYKSYMDTMGEFNVSNIIPENVSFKTYDECLDSMLRVHEYFEGDTTDSINMNLFNTLSSPIFAVRNKLFSIHGKGMNHDVLVVNDIIYENFGELFFDSKEITKLLHDLNRLCNQLSIKYIYQYLNDSSGDTVVLKKLIARMYELWKDANEIYQTQGPSAIMSLSAKEDTVFNGIFDEAHQIKFFMASEIAKFHWNAMPGTIEKFKNPFGNFEDIAARYFRG